MKVTSEEEAYFILLHGMRSIFDIMLVSKWLVAMRDAIANPKITTTSIFVFQAPPTGFPGLIFLITPNLRKQKISKCK